ncbi:MAG TPA: acyltransferase [Bacteroidia bacterium]|jgi:peptidoglycan/LPS O-acetylase OafA/YrhL|nr:acyltransferase [Bacteroidia bacterium]
MGILRFLLALSVIASHASGIGIPLPHGKPYPMWATYLIDGRQSVALFFIISGFYMAMVLNTKYQGHTLRFYGNRFLRLWPTYIIVLILACIFTPVGSTIIKMTTYCGLMVKSYVWLSNIFILGTDSFWLLSLDNCHLHYFPAFLNANSNGASLLVNQPAFSISMEMVFYLMAPFILRSLKRVWIYFGIGVLYYFYFVLSNNLNIIYQYHLFPASFIYFALGALAWHYSKNKNFELTDKKIILLFAGCIVLMFAYTLFSMILILCFTLMVPRLFDLTKHSKADRLIGELSYPLYIVHFPVLIYLRSCNIKQHHLGLLCFSITLVISILIHFIVERPIDKWRQKSISN